MTTTYKPDHSGQLHACHDDVMRPGCRVCRFVRAWLITGALVVALVLMGVRAI